MLTKANDPEERDKKAEARNYANQIKLFIITNIKRNTFKYSKSPFTVAKTKSRVPFIRTGELVRHISVVQNYSSFTVLIDDKKHKSGLSAKALFRILEEGLFIRVTPKMRIFFIKHFNTPLKKKFLYIKPRPVFNRLARMYILDNPPKELRVTVEKYRIIIGW